MDFKSVRIAKLTNAVGISPEQGEVIFPLIRRLEETRADHHEGMMRLEQDLRRALKIEPAARRAPVIAGLIQGHHESEAQFHRQSQELTDQILRQLAPEQQARYLLFRQEFPRHMRQTLHRMREERRRERREDRRRSR